MTRFEVEFYEDKDGNQPTKEIVKAKKYREDYLRREGEKDEQGEKDE